MQRRTILLGLVFVGAALVLAACATPGPAGPAGPAGPMGPPGPAGPGAEPADLACTGCHNDTTLIAGKADAWAGSLHGSGTATAYAGGRPACTGCHSGGGFADRIAAGNNNPDTVESADPNPSRPDCRACHQIHTSYTADDWALRTTDPVVLYAVEGSTFDGGMGNLCTNCHQPRRVFPAPENGIIKGITTHWGPHHGPQSAMLLGVAGAGVEGSPSTHYTAVEDSCVGCHMAGGGENATHTFAPAVAACQACHADAKNFDINGVQTEVEEMGNELGELLLAAGLINENTEAGHPTVTEAPEAQALALFNWLYVMHEDKSLGVHNPAYAKALLQAGIDALK